MMTAAWQYGKFPAESVAVGPFATETEARYFLYAVKLECDAGVLLAAVKR
jgi:hypothetical protein